MRRISVLLLTLAVALAARADRAGEWREDLQSLREQLERTHPKFKSCGVSPELQREFSELSARIETLTDAQITVQLQALLAAAGDGHTLLWPFGMNRGTLLRSPLQLWQFEEGLYIVRASDEGLTGQRVVRIGALDTNDIASRLTEYVSHDNAMQLRWAYPLYATFTDFLVAIGATTDRTSATLTLEDGRTVSIAAVPVDPKDLDTKLPVRGAATTFRSKVLDDGTLYIELNAVDDADNKTLEQFGRELRPQLAKTTRAILDLRFNSGGEARKANELLRSLIAFDANGGRLVILTSRITFSAAQTLATRLDEWTGAEFIGEATGSRPNHYGNERPFKLPHSGIRGTIASGFNQPVTANDDRDTIAPDIAIPWRARDYFSGADPVLDAAMKRE